jgi:hypothetical protein
MLWGRFWSTSPAGMICIDIPIPRAAVRTTTFMNLVSRCLETGLSTAL